MRRRRKLRKWDRYVNRYATPERGGFIDNARPVAYDKAVFRAFGEVWEPRYAYWSRRARRR